MRTDAARRRQSQAARSPPADACTPADRYQELFEAVQAQRVFPDSKTFVDCSPRDRPERILERYREERALPGFRLAEFVQAQFTSPEPARSGYVPVPGQAITAHIDDLWRFLTRAPDRHPHRGSLLPLPHRYVVPGGRFVELYYWDSYFTMLGLAESGRTGLLHAMTDNFAWLIDQHGHVPNGTRTYYLTRSQPPVFALMTQLCEERGGPPAVEYLAQLRCEHRFWMDGESGLPKDAAHRRLVRLGDGTLLNRYWDDRCTPREESWREDVATAGAASRSREEVWRHLRAAAESGWDFSTRWLDEDVAAPPLHSIRTTDLLPVDLNAFLHELERTIARLAGQIGDHAVADEFQQRAQRRAAAMARHCWNADLGAFVDHDWRRGVQRRCLTAATMVPLFCGIATREQARSVAGVVRQRLLLPGGFATTEVATGEQWDRPNGWAPLQWMAVRGLERYGERALARDIRDRWLATVQSLYDREGRLVEKYTLREGAAEAAVGGGGGEYPLQDGFGWTNGVTRRWLHEGGASAQAC